ncbi:hypothetical protein FZC78_09225 [Rossellomorea vietnamensis]|uniref:Uncharacterized protein n=1 Tax=Rossellomorea vietnamensis TaxID=218284 RepID=A0A5D4NZE2_9BACI|nr:hypothetical protein FZC78_09225 [Rossellomorea vietnamensis]
MVSKSKCCFNGISPSTLFTYEDLRCRRKISCGTSGHLFAAPSPSGSNNPHRKKGKTAFFSIRNIYFPDSSLR